MRGENRDLSNDVNSILKPDTRARAEDDTSQNE